MSILLRRALWLGLVFGAAASPAIQELDRDCGDRYTVGEKCEIEIQKVLPTQGAIGREEVRRKLAEIEKMDRDERDEYRKKKRIPVIIGPGQKLYMIDHHHSTLALLMAGEEKVYIEVKEDLSHFETPEEFWAEMIHRKWCYPFDGNGRPIPPTAIAHTLRQTHDDPYRSLAGIVRDLGAFDKLGVPFEEFEWANRFRALGLLDGNRSEDYDRAAHAAIALIDWGYWTDPGRCEGKLKRLLELLPRPKTGS
jgi:hypothetical protein